MAWYDSIKTDGKFISVKEGETVKFKVARVEMDTNGDEKWRPRKQDGTYQEYRIVIHTTEGKQLGVGTFSLQKELVAAKVDEGDEVTIRHPKRGLYIVEKA